MRRFIQCPQCGAKIRRYKNPFLTVDIIIEVEAGIVLIRRKNEPLGWAIPGGFVDYGEPLEEAAVREAKEETGLTVHLIRQFHTYSDPERDPRFHAISTVYIAKAQGVPRAQDDAQDVGIFDKHNLPQEIVFDHRKILEDYFTDKLRKKGGK
ncbi:MAG: NUDIX domain-containing protein [Thermodesulfobacteriota bacterium]